MKKSMGNESQKATFAAEPPFPQALGFSSMERSVFCGAIPAESISLHAHKLHAFVDIDQAEYANRKQLEEKNCPPLATGATCNAAITTTVISAPRSAR